MTNTPEGKVKQKIDALLKKYDVWYFKPRGTVMGRSGIPDYTCSVDGLFLGIEAKAGKNNLTALQVKEMNDIRAHGGAYRIVNETPESLHNLEYLIGIMKEKAALCREKGIINPEGW